MDIFYMDIKKDQLEKLNFLKKTGKTIICSVNQSQTFLTRNIKRGRDII